jgi:hypothetical protein
VMSPSSEHSPSSNLALLHASYCDFKEYEYGSCHAGYVKPVWLGRSFPDRLILKRRELPPLRHTGTGNVNSKAGISYSGQPDSLTIIICHGWSPRGSASRTSILTGNVRVSSSQDTICIGINYARRVSGRDTSSRSPRSCDDMHSRRSYQLTHAKSPGSSKSPEHQRKVMRRFDYWPMTTSIATARLPKDAGATCYTNQGAACTSRYLSSVLLRTATSRIDLYFDVTLRAWHRFGLFPRIRPAAEPHTRQNQLTSLNGTRECECACA